MMMYKDIDKIHEEREHLLSLHEKLLGKISKLADSLRCGNRGSEAADCLEGDIKDSLDDAAVWLHKQSERLASLTRHEYEEDLRELEARLKSIVDANIKMSEYLPEGGEGVEGELLRQIVVEQNNLLVTTENHIKRIMENHKEVIMEVDEIMGVNDSVMRRISSVTEKFAG